MLYSELITDMREDLSDGESTEWSDAQLLRFLNRAGKRMSAILARNQIQFAVKTHELTTDETTDTHDLPDDFLAQFGMYNTGSSARLSLLTPDSAERLVKAPNGAWSIIGTTFTTYGVAAGSSLILYYFPEFTKATTALDEVPFGDELWDVLMTYGAFLCKNVDEFDLSADAQILSDIESQIIQVYGRNTPQVAHLEP